MNKIDEMTQEEFLQIGEEGFYTNYILQNKPLIIRGALVDWPAYQLWTDEYLTAKLGFKKLPLTQKTDANEERFMPGKTDEKKRSFQMSKSLMQAKPLEYYVSDLPLPKVLKEDLGEHAALQAFLRLSQSERHINTYYGLGGQVTPLHYDDEENLYCVLDGQKRMILFDSSDHDRLYPFQEATGIDHSQVNLADPDLEQFPKFDASRSYEVCLNGGDILYIPCCWWHQVYSTERHLSIAFILTDHDRLANVFRKRLDAGAFDVSEEERQAAQQCLQQEGSPNLAALNNSDTPLLVALATWATWHTHTSEDTGEIEQALASRLMNSELRLTDKYFLSNALALSSSEINQAFYR